MNEKTQLQMYSTSEHIPYICFCSAAFQPLIIHIYSITITVYNNKLGMRTT